VGLSGFGARSGDGEILYECECEYPAVPSLAEEERDIEYDVYDETGPEEGSEEDRDRPWPWELWEMLDA
jgi:hypothetical protein